MKNKILIGLMLSMFILTLTFSVQAKQQKDLVCDDKLVNWTQNGQTCYTYSFGTYCYPKWSPVLAETCLNKAQSKLFNLNDTNQEKFDKKTTKCRVDSDCTTSRQSLCKCSSGGTEVAVNKIGKTIYDFMWLSNPNSWRISPYDLVCPQVYNCQTPKCINNRCTF